VDHPGQEIFMSNVLGDRKLRRLISPLECLMPDGTTEVIPVNFIWDGNSTPWFLLPFFPRHEYPAESCKHDYRCGKARNAAERKWADQRLREEVGASSNKLTKTGVYTIVRIGAYLGRGSNF